MKKILFILSLSLTIGCASENNLADSGSHESELADTTTVSPVHVLVPSVNFTLLSGGGSRFIAHPKAASSLSHKLVVHPLGHALMERVHSVSIKEESTPTIQTKPPVYSSLPVVMPPIRKPNHRLILRLHPGKESEDLKDLISKPSSVSGLIQHRRDFKVALINSSNTASVSYVLINCIPVSARTLRVKDGALIHSIEEIEFAVERIERN